MTVLHLELKPYFLSWQFIFPSALCFAVLLLPEAVFNAEFLRDFYLLLNGKVKIIATYSESSKFPMLTTYVVLILLIFFLFSLPSLLVSSSVAMLGKRTNIYM